MGWDIVSIDNEDEYNLINQAHLADYHQTEYFVGGRINSTADRPNQNFGFANDAAGKF